jgi:hypothetical protein
MKLAQLQTAFSDRVFAAPSSEVDATLAAHIRSGSLSAVRRIEIYRHNVFSALRGGLGDLYPIIKNIVGDDYFQAAADVYIRQTPSPSGDLNDFGETFSAFLKHYAPASELPYLGDVAAMEWAWHRAYDAADADGLDLARLAALPPELHAALVFTVHPSLRLVASPYPLFDIWRVNQPGYEGEMRVDWDTRGDKLAVSRPEFEVQMQQLDAGGFAFLAACAQGDALEAAASKAFEADAAFSLQTRLIELVQTRLIVGFL